MYKSIFFLLLLILASSCANINSLIDQGDYDRAIDKLVNKLQGKKNKKREYIIQLEYAFQKAQDLDLRKEKSLRDENLAENWTKIYSIHSSISNRQHKVEPLLPLFSKDGYQGTFKFINIDELKNESKKNTADYYYQSAVLLIDESRQTADKAAARKAYEYLSKIDGLFNHYKDKEQLKKIAYSLSLQNYLVKIVNNTKQIIPQDIEEELLKLSLEGLNGKFKNFDVKKNPSVSYDYYIVMNLLQLEFTPERERSRVYDDINEVVTEEPKKDKNGKILRDSTGKEIKEKVTTKYIATIEEISQSKSVLLSSKLEYIHAISGELEFSKPIQVEGVFDNRMARLIKGDSNKVTDECKKRLHGKLLPFPTNETLLLDAAEKMKRIVKDIIISREK